MSTVDAQKVIAICRDIENYTPIKAAMRKQGLHETRQDWQKAASEGEDPFWAWALTCLMMAEGSSITTASSALGERIEEGDTKAITFFLSKRSHAYQDRKTVEVNHTGAVTHAVVARANQLLLDGTTNIAELAERRRAMLEQSEPDLLEAHEIEDEPHPLFRVKKPKRRDQ